MKHAVWIVGLYLLADLVTAGLPGAFSFEAETLIEVARAQRSTRAHLHVPADVTPAASLDARNVRRCEGLVFSARMPSGPRGVVTWPPPLRAATEPTDVEASEAA
jgi:hypothetical protein